MTQRTTADKQLRLIKKYPNRRLYDTKTSAYITLDDVRSFVVSGERFQVVDAKTEENLTRSILLQIILEAETGGTPLFTEEALANMIRFYGNTFQGTMGSFLEHNIRTFLEMQHKLQEQNRLLFNNKAYQPDSWTQLLSTPNPATQVMMGSYVEQSRQAFAHMQEAIQAQSRAMFGGFNLGIDPLAAAKRTPPPTAVNPVNPTPTNSSTTTTTPRTPDAKPVKPPKKSNTL